MCVRMSRLTFPSLAVGGSFGYEGRSVPGGFDPEGVRTDVGASCPQNALTNAPLAPPRGVGVLAAGACHLHVIHRATVPPM